MRRIFKRLPTPAMLVAGLALVLALGGTAMAGGPLTKKQFTKRAVRAPISYVTATAPVNNNAVPGPNTPGINITAQCPPGSYPTGGGVKSGNLSGFSGLFVQYSYPNAPRGWTANVYAGSPPPGGGALQPENVSVTAVCVQVKKIRGALPAVTL